jgi:hypothetical protein
LREVLNNADGEYFEPDYVKESGAPLVRFLEAVLEGPSTRRMEAPLVEQCPRLAGSRHVAQVAASVTATIFAQARPRQTPDARWSPPVCPSSRLI